MNWYEEEAVNSFDRRGVIVQDPNIVIRYNENEVWGCHSPGLDKEQLLDGVLWNNGVSVSRSDEFCAAHRNSKVEVWTRENKQMAWSGTLGELYEHVVLPKRKAVAEYDYNLESELAQAIPAGCRLFEFRFDYSSKRFLWKYCDHTVEIEPRLGVVREMDQCRVSICLGVGWDHPTHIAETRVLPWITNRQKEHDRDTYLQLAKLVLLEARETISQYSRKQEGIN